MSGTRSKRNLFRFRSLRTQIAFAYAALFVGVIACAAIALTFALRSILIDEAKAHCEQVSDEIAHVADRQNADVFEDLPVQVMLANQASLENWASPTTFVQIDTAAPYPIGKSSNMGGLTFLMRTPLAPGEQRFLTLDTPFGRVLLLDRSLISGGRVVAIAHVAERLSPIDALFARGRTVLLLVTVLAALALLAASVFIARALVDPIERLTAAMAEIGSDRLDRRLHWTDRNDEVGKLAATFDAMIERLQEAFARERQFISDASHELKTPLTVINANAQMLTRWAERDPQIRHDSLAAIADESRSLAQMVNGMLLLAKADSGDGIPKEPVDVGVVVREVVDHARDRAAEKGLSLDIAGSPEPLMVPGDANLLRQLVNNLVDNAMKFTPSGGVTVSYAATGDRGLVEVADTGIGLGDAAGDRLFDRFFRGDRSHSRAIEGTGLGLAIVRSIARVHDGTVSARPRAGGGSIFSVSLPIVGKQPIVIERS